MKAATDARRLLLDCYQAALSRVDGRAVVRTALAHDPLPSHMVAIGKAAEAMLLGALDVSCAHAVSSLVITRHGYANAGLSGRAIVIESGHPVPDAASVEAGEALLRFIEHAPADASFLFLISGGASALAEVLPPGVGLDDLMRVNTWLLGSGLDIAAMNRIRKRLSLIKQGRLACRLLGRKARVLLLSDVPGDDASVIGSGLLAADALAHAPLPPDLPAWLRSLLDRGIPAPLPGDVCFEQVQLEIIATNALARDAAAEHARRRGLPVCMHRELLASDAVAAGERIAHTLMNATPGLHIWGGETSVVLPAEPGRGGRCQHLALAAACVLSGQRDICVLAAGTDGSDGPGEDAGALVDGETVRRGEEAGFDARDALRRADSGSFLEASGDLVTTGPTGTNVMDLVLAWKGKIAP